MVRCTAAVLLVLVGCSDRPSGDGSSSAGTTGMSGTGDEGSTAATVPTSTSAPTSTDGSSSSDSPGSSEAATGFPETSLGTAPTIHCEDLPPGAVGEPYEAVVTVANGEAPYVWEAIALPPGLELAVDIDSSVARIVGDPAEAGSFPVTLAVEDALGSGHQIDCGVIDISGTGSIDADALVDAFADGCVPPGVSLAELLALGILGDAGDDGWTCAFKTGRGNGSGDFDEDNNTPDTMPPGVTLDPDTCTVGGSPVAGLRFGTYAWITTFSRAGIDMHVPFCAAQMVSPPTAYDVVREDAGAPATFVPGLQRLMPGEGVMYGTDEPDPRTVVTYNQACGVDCFYGFFFLYNTLTGSAMVTANPNQKFPQVGFEGFSHAIRMADADPMLLDRFDGRAWVVNVTFDYCIADNDVDCGTSEPDPFLKAELIRANGGGSGYYFSLVLLPE